MKLFKKLRMNERGQEVPDPVPVAPPVNLRREMSLEERVRMLVRSERLAEELRSRDRETFEEADDFDIPDDPIDPSTPYEADFEGENVRELRRRHDEAAPPPVEPQEPAPPAPSNTPAPP